MRLLLSAFVLGLDSRESKPVEVGAGEVRHFGPKVGASIGWHGIDGFIRPDPGARVAFGNAELSGETPFRSGGHLQIEAESFDVCLEAGRGEPDFALHNIADPRTRLTLARGFLRHIPYDRVEAVSVAVSLPSLDPATRLRAHCLVARRLSDCACGYLLQLAPGVFICCSTEADGVAAFAARFSDTEVRVTAWGVPVAARTDRAVRLDDLTMARRSSPELERMLDDVLTAHRVGGGTRT